LTEEKFDKIKLLHKHPNDERIATQQAMPEKQKPVS